MSDNETPSTPASSAKSPGSEGAREGAGKVISADVFLARLAERRQAERASASGETPEIDVILGALESIGLDPEQVAPDFVKMSRENALSEGSFADTDPTPPSLEELALEQSLLEEMREGRTPSLGARVWRDATRQTTLMRLAATMNPDELAGMDELAGFTPEQEAALRAGLDAGTRGAVREVARRAPARRRGRGGARRVAEERAPYTASQPDSTTGERSDHPGKNEPER